MATGNGGQGTASSAPNSGADLVEELTRDHGLWAGSPLFEMAQGSDGMAARGMRNERDGGGIGRNSGGFWLRWMCEVRSVRVSAMSVG